MERVRSRPRGVGGEVSGVEKKELVVVLVRVRFVLSETMLVRVGGVSGGVSGRLLESGWMKKLDSEDLVLGSKKVEDSGGSDGGR